MIISTETSSLCIEEFFLIKFALSKEEWLIFIKKPYRI